MTNTRVKLFYGNQHTTISLSNKWEQFKFYVKLWNKRLAIGCLVAWLVVGGIKVGQTVAPRETVYAENRVEVPVNEDIPVLEKIVKCESGGKQLGKDGQLNVNINVQQDGSKSIDVGWGQINTKVWGATATKMGYDLTKEADNKAFTRWLFLNKGSSPWSASSNCWNR